MGRQDRTLLLGLAALTALFAALTFVGVHQDLLLAAPVLVLVLLLLDGRYVGEEGIARLAAVHAGACAPRLRPAASLACLAQRAPRILPRGGRLIATALAVRPPPAPLSLTA